MVCRFVGSNYRDKFELCLVMALNDTFNFSAFDAWMIIKQSREQTNNVGHLATILLLITYSTLIVLGILSNFVVSFVVARRPQMHTARNLYIVNLTVSDLTLCIICMPFTLFHILYRNWTLGVALCKLMPFVQGTNIMVSVGTITVIALDRYFTIVRGQDGPTTRRRVIFSIIAVWVISMLTCAPVLFFQKWLWFPEPLKIGRYSPLKNAEITYHNKTLVNFGPPDNMPEYYTYGYKVYDSKAGELKDHREFRSGGLIHGSLKVAEKSGEKTNIAYEGLPWSGWQALIETQDSPGGQPANVTTTASITTAPSTTTSSLVSTELTTSKASSTQTTTGATSQQASTTVSISSTETPSTQTTTKAISTTASTVAQSKLTSDPSTKPTSGPTLASKMARIGGKMTSKSWLQIYRICPSTDPSLRKTPNMFGQVAQTWQYPAQKQATFSWNPLYHRMSSIRPPVGNVFMDHDVFPMSNHPFRYLFTARYPSHRLLSETLFKPTSASQFKLYSIHHKKTDRGHGHNPRYRRRSRSEVQDSSRTIFVE